MRHVYSPGTLMFITAVIAFAVVKELPFLLFAFGVQFILVIVGIEMLHRRIPPSLHEASSDNCTRLDGSLSPRRQKKEQQARLKFRLDLLAVFSIVVLTGNWLAFFVHSEVIPIPIAFQSLAAFDPDPETWKENLRDQRVSESFEEWAVTKTPATHEEVEAQQKVLWYTWPSIIGIAVIWFVGSGVFISRAYLRILREFASGIAARTQLNLNRDIARMQSEESFEGSSA